MPFPGYTVAFGASCPGDSTTIGYDVSVIKGNLQIAGVGLFGGSGASVTGDGVTTENSGGSVFEVGCLGAGNAAVVPPTEFSPVVSDICTNPSGFVLFSSAGPSGTLFPPVSSISVAIDLDEDLADHPPSGSDTTVANVSPFTNVFLQVPEPPSLMLLIPGLLALAVFRLKKATA